MANEAVVQSGLSINFVPSGGSLQYASQPKVFTATVATANGPTPGVVLCAVTGTNVDLSALASPGLCRFMNIDATNFVQVGIYDGTNFFPFLKLLPGETFVVRLSPNIGREYAGTGLNGDTDHLRIMADTAACKVVVEAFDS